MSQFGVDEKILKSHLVNLSDTHTGCYRDNDIDTGTIVVVENHNIIGGSGSVFCEVVCKDCSVPGHKIRNR